MHNYVLKEGLVSDVLVVSALIEMYATKSGLVLNASTGNVAGDGIRDIAGDRIGDGGFR